MEFKPFKKMSDKKMGHGYTIATKSLLANDL